MFSLSLPVLSFTFLFKVCSLATSSSVYSAFFFLLLRSRSVNLRELYFFQEGDRNRLATSYSVCTVTFMALYCDAKIEEHKFKRNSIFKRILRFKKED